MRLGRLDTFIEIVRNGEIGRDEFNTPIYGEAVVVEAMAERVQQSGREYLAADGVQASRRIVFRTHRQPDIRLTDHVRMDGALLNIREVRPVGRLHMELHTEGAAS
uniref:Putative head-tail joining protein n=1 Tax=viral metagenome TaxID=1070528 RepID=A0A6H1ZUM6_9ZZZZ